MTGLTWLHLSDWHQKGKDFDRHVVRKALVKDIKNREAINPDLKKIDFIVFSGDVAFSGKPDEYKAAKKEFFEPLLKETNLSPEKIFIVPGNHDLDRTQFEMLPASLSRSLDSDLEAKNWLFDVKKRSEVLKPFKAFKSFVRQYTKQKNSDYANIREMEIFGKKIALLGINSAWMCGRRKNSKDEIDDKGVVIVGEPQIFDLLEDISEFDIKIAVLHHPFEWLADFESSQIMSRLIKGCNFILRGHQHEPQVSLIRSTYGDCVVIPAGACYDRRIYANAYNFVHIDFESGRGDVFLRCWNGKDDWREDIDSSPGGKFEFNIYESTSKNHQLNCVSQKSEKDTPIDLESKEIVPSLIPHQIPPPPADFKGRDDELKNLEMNFDNKGAIIGLRGMSGVGKTALALAIANKINDRFPDGQLFIDLHGLNKKPLTSSEAMAHVILSYYPTARLPDDQNGRRGLYLSVLTGKRIFLLLDNAANREQIEPLLLPEGCAVLFTSQQRFTLPGLKSIDLDILPLSKSRELLLAIAERIGEHAEELAESCGHLPLALRNAASVLVDRVDISVEEYAKLLKDAKKRLDLVDASFSLSYELLPSDMRVFWCLLSVFPSNFDRAGASSIWRTDIDTTSKLLSDFVKWSLVEYRPAATSTSLGRYHLHGLARLFADSRLDPIACSHAQLRHAEHYRDILANAEMLYLQGGKNVLIGLELFDREWANIRASQTWAKEMAECQNKQEELEGLEIKSILCLSNMYPDIGTNILSLRLHPSDWIQLLETAIVAARQLKDHKRENKHLICLGEAFNSLGKYCRCIELLKEGLAIAQEKGDKQLENYALVNLGWAYNDFGEYRQAIDFLGQGLTIARHAGNRFLENNALINLGRAYNNLGEYHRAIELLKQGLAIAQEIGDKRLENLALINLGWSYNDLCEYQQAFIFLERGQTISIEIGDKRLKGYAMMNMSYAYNNQGEYSQANEFLVHALEIARGIGEKRFEGYTLFNLGKVCINLSKNGQAIEFFEQSLAIAREIGDKRLEGYALISHGWACNNLGKNQEILRFFEQGLEIARKIGEKRLEGNAQINLGKFYNNLNEFQQSIEFFDHALTIAREIGNLRGECIALVNLGKVYCNLGDYGRASKFLESAQSIIQTIREGRLEIYVLVNLGDVYNSMGDRRKAIEFFERALVIARQIGDLIGECKALWNISLALDGLGDRSKAIYHAKLSIKICEKIENSNARKFRIQLMKLEQE